MAMAKKKGGNIGKSGNKIQKDSQVAKTPGDPAGKQTMPTRAKTNRKDMKIKGHNMSEPAAKTRKQKSSVR